MLASIPLIVSGLEHYAEGVGTIKKWLKYKRELDLLVDVLATECVQFQGTCERLLEGLVDPDELDALIEEPGGVGWEDVELERKLKARLGRSYDPYLRTVRNMDSAVKTFTDKLNLDGDRTVKLSVRSPVRMARSSLQERSKDTGVIVCQNADCHYSRSGAIAILSNTSSRESNSACLTASIKNQCKRSRKATMPSAN